MLKIRFSLLFTFLVFLGCTNEYDQQVKIAETIISSAERTGQDTDNENPRINQGFTHEKRYIKELHLNGLGLTALPKNIVKLSSLELLNLSDNNFKEIPTFVGELKTLKELNLENNKLKTLPEELSNLKRLKKINLAGNQIQSLPSRFVNSESLGYIDLGSNQLVEFPSYLLGADNLTVIRLQDNELSKLPKEINTIINLEHLTLNKNLFTVIPDVLYDFKYLKSIAFSLNKIVVTKDIAGLKSIESIYLKQCGLSRLPKEIMELDRLNWPANPDKPGRVGIHIEYNKICQTDGETVIWLNKHARSGWINTQTCGN